MLTAQHVQAVLRAIPGAYGNQRATLAVLADGTNEALASAPAGLTVQGAAAFLATMSQESGSFRYLEEIRKDGRYAPYIGRTFEQITWRDNYAAFGAWCLSRGLLTDADAFVKAPRSLADIRWAWLGGVWFWQKNGIWAYGNKGDFLATQRAVNLGNPNTTATPNGIAARRAWYAAWLKIGADLLPTATTPTPTPTEPLMHSAKYGDYVSWRGGNFPPQTRDKLLAIPSSVRVTQGGLSFAKASAQTHAGLGAFDLNTDGMSKAQVWEQAKQLLSVGIIAFPRGFNSDSFQGRTISNTNDGNEHLHCIDTDEYSHLHPEAQSQVNEWKRWKAGNSKDGDGLLGSHPYYGPNVSLGKWADSPWNPKNIAIKELELPSVQEVSKELATDKAFLAAVAKAVVDALFSADVIPNVFTGNPANTTVTLPTALTSIGKKASTIDAKSDALAASVAASFPKPAA